MTEEEERDYDACSFASVSVPKRPWRAQEDSIVSKPQPQNISFSRQARPVLSQAVAKAQSVKSSRSDQRSVQLQSSAVGHFVSDPGSSLIREVLPNLQ